MGDLLGSPCVASLLRFFFVFARLRSRPDSFSRCFYFPYLFSLFLFLFLFFFIFSLLARPVPLKCPRVLVMSDAIIPALKHRIPSELRS